MTIKFQPASPEELERRKGATAPKTPEKPAAKAKSTKKPSTPKE